MRKEAAMSERIPTTGPSIQCIQGGGRVACAVDLTDKGVLRHMLVEVLSGVVTRTPSATALHDELVPGFVDAIIFAANSCNQSPELEDVAHTLIENELTPVQCRILIDAIGDYRAVAMCKCPGGSVVEVGELRRHYGEHKFKTFFGRIWARVLEAAGGHDDEYWQNLEDKAADEDWERRAAAGQVSGSASPRSTGGPRG